MGRTIEIDVPARVSLDDFEDEDIKEEAERRGLTSDMKSADILDALMEADAPEWIISGIRDWLAEPKPKGSLGAALMRSRNAGVR